MLYEISQEIKNEIKNKYLKDNLVLFAGAGLSMPFSIGSWKELIEKAAHMCNVNKNTYLSIEGKLKKYEYNEAVEILKADILSRYPNENAEYFVQNIIAQQIEIRQNQLFPSINAYMPGDREFCPEVPTTEHNYLDIARYTGFRLMVTTNYDTILSKYTGADSYSITESPKITIGGMQQIFMNNHKRYVFHLHGIYTSPESIVLSNDSYAHLYSNEKYKNLMKLFDGTKSMFCIGFSMNDAYVKNMLLEDIVRFSGKHYIMLAFDGETARNECHKIIEEFKKDNLIVIPYYPHYPDNSVTYAKAIKMSLYNLLGLPSISLYEKLQYWLNSTKKYFGNYVLENLYTELFHDLEESGTGNVYKAITINGETETSLLTYLRKMWNEGLYTPVLLKGTGGSGKTVAMQNTCQRLLEEKICAIYIPLCDFKCGTLDEYIREKILYTPILSSKDDLWNTLQYRCTISESNIPNVVLFLDGINELITGTENVMSLRSDLRNWLYNKMPGVQIVFSSRGSLETQGFYCEHHCLKVKPLNDFQIIQHFKNLGHPLPEKGGKIWELIRNPLMLSLFLYTSTFKKAYKNTEHIFGDWIVNDDPNATQIIHNFILCQLYKNTKNSPDSFDAALWYYSVEYGAAKIGWELYQKSEFQADELQLATWLEEINEEQWENSRQMKRLLLHCHKNSQWRPDSYEQIRSLCDILNLLCINGTYKDRETGNNEPSWGFMHQSIRDYFAARALLNDWLNGQVEERSRWREIELNVNVLEFLGTMLKTDQWMNVWKYQSEHRKMLWKKEHCYINDKECYLELNLLHLSKYIYNIDYDNIQLSWHDLRNIPLYKWNKIAQRENIDFSGTLVSRKTFFTLGHTSYIYIARFSPNRQYLLTVSADQTMILWDANLLCPLFTYVEKNYDVDGIAWSADSNKFLSWGNDKHIVYWNIMEAEGKCIFEATHMLSGGCVQWHGTHECIVYDNGLILVVNIDGTFIKKASIESAIRVNFSGNGNYIATIKRKGFYIYDINHIDKPILWKECECTEDSNLIFAPNEKDFIFYNRNMVLVYRDRKYYKLNIKKVQNVIWSSDGQYFYISNKALRRYMLHNLKSIKVFDQIENFDIIDISPLEGNIFVGKGVYCYLYDENGEILLQQYHGEDRRIYQLIIDVSGNKVITATKKKVKHWIKGKKRFQVALEKKASTPLDINSLLVTDDFELLSSDGTKKLTFSDKWTITQINNNKVHLYCDNEKLFQESMYAIQWSKDGSTIVGLDWKFNYYIWNANTGKLLVRGMLEQRKIGLIESIILGKDNKSIFFNTQEGDLWRIQQKVVEKIYSGRAFGYLKNLDNNSFIAKNCNYTTGQIFNSESGEVIEELVSIDGISIVGAQFYDTDFGGDTELKSWIICNGGLLT